MKTVFDKVIPISPFHYERARTTPGRSKPRTPDRYSKRKEHLMKLLQIMWRSSPIQGPVSVDLVFEIKRAKRPIGFCKDYPAKKPDLDNLIKAVLDCMQPIIIQDDYKVVQIKASKVYGQVENIWMKVQTMDEDGD